LSSHADKVTDSIYSVAMSHFEKGDYDIVLEKAIEALKILEQKGSCNERAYATMKVGRAYYYLQQREMSLGYLLQAYNMGKQCKIDSLQWLCARQMGAIHFELGRKDSSLKYFHIADHMLKGKNEIGEKAMLYCLMGELYYRSLLDTVKGKFYFDEGLKYALLSKDKQRMAFAYIKQGAYATSEDDCALGIKHFNKALQLYTEANLVEGRMYAMKTLAWALSECEEAEETYRTLSRYQTIRDSIFKATTAENTAKYRTLYETEKKEREVAELERSRKILLLVFVAIVLALGVVFTLLWSRYKLRKQKEIDEYLAKQQELRFDAVIEAEENERRRIASDLHDGVGQTMSAAKINLAALYGDIDFTNEEQRTAYEKIVALVDESCREVRTVSHNMMPNALLKSGLASAVRAFVNQIDGRVIKVNFYSEGLNEKLDSNTEGILYRVIQECVNNVIKHSGANHLDISLIKDEEGISATIEDNGKGFDTSRQEMFEGIGLKNIISRVSYLKGTVEWESSPGKGTVVVIRIAAEDKK
jgi:signal transduction histidine kinase